MLVNLTLIFLLLLLFLGRSSLALWLILPIGFLLELFSAAPFGLLIASFLIAIGLARLLFNYFFTNRSLPALLALCLCGTLIHYLAFWLLNLTMMIKIVAPFSLTPAEYIWLMLRSVFFNLIISAIVFFLINRFSKKLKSVFLINQ